MKQESADFKDEHSSDLEELEQLKQQYAQLNAQLIAKSGSTTLPAIRK